VLFRPGRVPGTAGALLTAAYIFLIRAAYSGTANRLRALDRSRRGTQANGSFATSRRSIDTDRRELYRGAESVITIAQRLDMLEYLIP